MKLRYSVPLAFACMMQFLVTAEMALHPTERAGRHRRFPRPGGK